jgi:hypothetical protein
MAGLLYYRKKLLYSIIFFAVFTVFSGNSQAKTNVNTKVVRVMGTGELRASKAKKDTAYARDKAIANSLFLAVETAIVDILPVGSLVQSFDILNRICYDNIGNYIMGYKVLTETRHGNLYRVLVQADVAVDKLQDRLVSAGVVLGKKAMPKLLFLIAEKRLSDNEPQYWWNSKEDFLPEIIAETVMTEMVKANGLSVIEHGIMQQDPDNETAIFTATLDDQTAVQLGILLQADLVIVGKSIAKQLPNTMGEDIKSFKGILSARAIRTDTGKQIASTNQSSVTVNVDEITGKANAIKDAASLAARELARSIVAAWQKDEGVQSSMVEIVVERTGNLANFISFRNEIGRLHGVKAIQNKGLKPKEALIVVKFQGSTDELAQALMLKTFNSFGIRISEMTDKSFKIMLIPN